MNKRYYVFITIREYDEGVNSDCVYTDELRGFRTKFGAVSFLKRIVRKFKN